MTSRNTENPRTTILILLRVDLRKYEAQPPRAEGLPLEFSAVTPQVVGPRAKPSIDFPLQVMNIYKTNLYDNPVFNDLSAMSQ